jgi:hypothetical protein
MGLAPSERIGPRGETAESPSATRNRKNEDDSREDELRAIIDEASVMDPQSEVVRVAKDALYVETLRREAANDREDALSVEVLDMSEARLKQNVERLMQNKTAFAQRLVALYKPRAATQPPVKKQRVPPTPEAKEGGQPNMYQRMIADLNDITQRALVPLMTFTGMVSGKMRELDMRPFLLFRPDNASVNERLKVFDQTADTKEAFLETVRDAGPTLVTMYLNTIEEESLRNISRVDEEDKVKRLQSKQNGGGDAFIGACFDLDELDKDFADLSHPGYHQRQLQAGFRRDETVIQQLRDQLQTVEQSIRAERVRRVSELIAQEQAAIDRLRTQIQSAEIAGAPAAQLALMRADLADKESRLAALRVDPNTRVHALEDRAQALRESILERQRVSADRVTLNEARTLMAEIAQSDVERKFAPAWAFQVIGSAIFRRVLNDTTLASFEAALASVRRIPGCEHFEMKELICSPGVADMFAFLVASNFLSSGDGSETKRKGGKYDGRSTYLNVSRMRDILAAKVLCCKVWFESVYKRQNPLVKQFKDKFDRLYAQKKQQAGDDHEILANVERWKARMMAYQNMLPQYELIYDGNR